MQKDISVDRLMAKELIDTLYADVYLRIDRRSDACVSELFTEDADLAYDQNRWVGREEIAAFFKQYHALNHANERTTRHVTLNRSMKFLSDTECTVRCTAMVYAGFGKLPVNTTEPVTIADFDDLCALGGDGQWRVRQRRSTTIFVREGLFDFSKAPGTAPSDSGAN